MKAKHIFVGTFVLLIHRIHASYAKSRSAPSSPPSSGVRFNFGFNFIAPPTPCYRETYVVEEYRYYPQRCYGPRCQRYVVCILNTRKWSTYGRAPRLPPLQIILPRADRDLLGFRFLGLFKSNGDHPILEHRLGMSIFIDGSGDGHAVGKRTGRLAVVLLAAVVSLFFFFRFDPEDAFVKGHLDLVRF